MTDGLGESYEMKKWDVFCENNDLRLENDELKAENAELRKLVRDYIDAPCTTCDCWQDEFRCWNYDGADCGLVARARELGVEV